MLERTWLMFHEAGDKQAVHIVKTLAEVSLTNWFSFKLFHSNKLELSQHNNQLKPSCWILQSALFAQLIIMRSSSPLYKWVFKIFMWSAKS